MQRFDLLFLAAIPLAGAGSAYAAPHFDGAMTPWGIAGAGVGLCVSLIALTWQTRRELAQFRRQTDETRRQAAALARVTRELSGRVAMLDGAPERLGALPESAPVDGEIAVLGSLVRDLAQSVADLEVEVHALRRTAQNNAAPAMPASAGTRTTSGLRTSLPPLAAPAPLPPAPTFVSTAPAATDMPRPAAPAGTSISASLAAPAPTWLGGTPPAPAPEKASILREDLTSAARGAAQLAARTAAATAPAPTPAPPETPAMREARRLVAAAIAADRFELFLQPIVNLPQRKPRAYEVMLRPEGASAQLTNGAIRQAVEAVGHQPAFDTGLLLQAVRVAQALEARGRDASISVQVSAAFLANRADVDDFCGLIEAERGIAQRLTLGIAQADFLAAAAAQTESLARLVGVGCRLALTDVEDLRLDPLSLSERGFRWVRVEAETLLAATEENGAVAADVVATDLAALLARRGLSLLAAGINTEQTVADLIEFNVQMAQGPLISPPRPFKLDGNERPVAPAFPAPPPAANANPVAASAAPLPEISEPAPSRGLRQLARQAKS